MNKQKTKNLQFFLLFVTCVHDYLLQWPEYSTYNCYDIDIIFSNFSTILCVIFIVFFFFSNKIIWTDASHLNSYQNKFLSKPIDKIRKQKINNVTICEGFIQCVSLICIQCEKCVKILSRFFCYFNKNNSNKRTFNGSIYSTCVYYMPNRETKRNQEKKKKKICIQWAKSLTSNYEYHHDFDWK